MQAEGTLEIGVSRASTWDALTDPAVLADCVSGAGSMSIEPASPTELAVRGRIGQGFLSLPAVGRVELSDLSRPNAAAAILHGSVAGATLQATGRVTLEAMAPDRTLLRWAADASLEGPLAGMATPYLDREGPGWVARMLDRLRNRLESEPVSGPA
ncbi:MAG: SRPBCC domain-containing protein [Candidatus Limnocylindrales bacterium]